MTDKGMIALLLSALLLESLCPHPAAAEPRRHSHKQPQPDQTAPTPDAVDAAAKTEPRIEIIPETPIDPAKRPGATPAAPPAPSVVVPRPVSAVTPAPNVAPATATPRPALSGAPVPTAEQPPLPLRGQRKSYFKTLAIAGAGIVGSTYVLSAALGAISYGAFVDGQWGWFVPIVGPVLVMSGVCGNPGSCYFKTVFTYLTGPLTTVSYLTGITLAIVGAVGYKRSSLSANSVQLLPYAGRDSSGLVLVGRF